MIEWKGKKVLISGGFGMIGRELIFLLLKEGANVYVADKNVKTMFGVQVYHVNLTIYPDCQQVCEGMDYVFHLAGIKGSPKMTNEKPCDFMVPMLQFDTNMIAAAQKAGVKKFLYTSSIAVEHPEEDKYPAHAKLTAELLLEAMKVQHPKGMEYVVVRPANVYGRFDQWNENSMVVTSLLHKAETEEKLSVWGDGTQIRDFINAKDVARGMIQAMEDSGNGPYNLCSGKGITIKHLAEVIARETGKEIVWDTTKPRGTDSRVMEINWDFKPEIEIEEGINQCLN